jgi:hypothetical protein
MNAQNIAVSPSPSNTGALNTLFRVELTAVESYDRALPAFEGQPAGAELHRLRDAHAEAVVLLRERVILCGGVPAEEPGAWPGLAAQALGPATVLRALHEGEQHSMSEYEAALTGGELDPEAANLVRSRLLPQCREHVLHLDRLMAGR